MPRMPGMWIDLRLFLNQPEGESTLPPPGDKGAGPAVSGLQSPP